MKHGLLTKANMLAAIRLIRALGPWGAKARAPPVYPARDIERVCRWVDYAAYGERLRLVPL